MVFAALGAWIGAYATMKYLRWRSACAAQDDCAAVVHAGVAIEPTSDLVVACGQRLTPANFQSDERFAA